MHLSSVELLPLVSQVVFWNLSVPSLWAAATPHHFHVFCPTLLMVAWSSVVSVLWVLSVSFSSLKARTILQFSTFSVCFSFLFEPFKTWLCGTKNILIIFWYILLILNAVWTQSQWYKFEQSLRDLSFIIEWAREILGSYVLASESLSHMFGRSGLNKSFELQHETTDFLFLILFDN